jgi:phage-related protein (TIGR01555 family)
VQENLWGISVLERVYDRMTAFDMATTGAAQLVNKSYIRTMKINGLRQIIAAGGPALEGLTAQVNFMRSFQGIEGITLMDGEDQFEGQTHSAFGGLSDALTQFGQQVSGALQIPLVRLFGQSPSGFSTGDTDLRNYYDGVRQKQVNELGEGVDIIYRAIMHSKGIPVPEDFGLEFRPLWLLKDTDKSAIAAQDAQSIGNLEASGLLDKSTALKELKQSSRITGRFMNITEQQIADAEGEMAPSAAAVLEGMNERSATRAVQAASVRGNVGADPEVEENTEREGAGDA